MPEKRAAMKQWPPYLDWVLTGNLEKGWEGRDTEATSLTEERARRAAAA